MNKFQLLKLKCKKFWHPYSETVYGFDLSKMPPYLRKNIPKSEYDLALQLPIIPAGDGILLVNEYFPEWETVRDLLVALDVLPKDFLKYIYEAEKQRYPDAEKAALLENDSASEKARKIIFMLCPELLKVQSKKHL